MMRRKKLFLISFVLLIIVVLIFSSYMLQDKDSESTSSDPIENLINRSLSIQYGINNIDLHSVFTKRFIDSIDSNSNFYKEKLAPYQITFKNYNLKEIVKNEYVVSVNIEDRNGRYIQIVHIVKEDKVYLISKIEYDI